MSQNKTLSTYEGTLKSTEIQSAENYWLKIAQTDLAKRMKKGDLKTLSPFLDTQGIIRVGGLLSCHI